jgi:hypothetical protein
VGGANRSQRPGPDYAGNLIEVGVLATDDGPLIIHAMAACTGRFQPPKE